MATPRYLQQLINRPFAARARQCGILSGVRKFILPATLIAVSSTYLVTANYARPPRAGSAPIADQPAIRSEGSRTMLPGGVRWRSRLHVVDRAQPADVQRMKDFAAGRTGYIVWESRRPSGTKELKYRVWKRNLDGSGLEMISSKPFQAGYAHLGPRISPDGRHVIFAGRRWNSSSSGPGVRAVYGGAYASAPFDAWVVEIDPQTLKAGEPRELFSLRERLGTAGEDRFFEWKNSRTVYVNIPDQKGIYEVDVVADRIGEKVVTGVRGQALLSAGGEYLFCAAGGGACFYRLNRGGPVPTAGKQEALEGCQATISTLGDFVVWMQAPGKVGVFDLKGARTPKGGEHPGRDLGLRRAIERACPPYHHCYFPAISRDRTIVACGASRYPPGVTPDKRWMRQSHKGADYEIFAVRFDPQTLKVVGPPVRYSYNEHNMHVEAFSDPGAKGATSSLLRGHALDRWPDVWVKNPEFEKAHGAPAHPATPGPKDAARRLLAKARELETVNPRAALDLYIRLGQEYAGSAGGEGAVRRAEQLDRDPGFQKELNAWAVFEEMHRAEARIKPPPSGPKSFRKNPELPRDNAHILRAIQTNYARLLKSYSSTRAMLEARYMVCAWDIEVPKETPANLKAVAVAEVVTRRVSRPAAYEAVYPYTQAFMTVECEVRKVIWGTLEERMIVVVMMSMDGGKDLPPAAYRPGRICRLRLGLWSAQTDFESHPMADDIMDLDADYYFALPPDPAH